MQYYSDVSIKYCSNTVSYNNVLELFLALIKKFAAIKINYLAVMDTYFDEKGYQRVRKSHEYKTNIENRIATLTDEYNLYGIGFETSYCNIMFDWNKNRKIFHLSIESDVKINEEIIVNIVKFVEEELLIQCRYDVESFNKKFY